MAVADKINSTLRLVLYDGEDMETGKPIYKTKSFNNVKTDAIADQLLPIAEAVAGLQERPLFNVQRNDSSELREA
ncbi:DUF1659 domain-containing protein [Virgibacillus byunsanensis]|uniref:DUF1659 domain-containing protein n=1 Tax=Virgibacillus byunsanensis TaxID=570945 RepID=A0ABW3LJ21_9BACI